MKKLLSASILAASMLSLSITSCDNLKPAPVPDDIVGDTPGELKAKINELLEQAGTDSTKVEFAEIASNFQYKPGDNNANVHVQIVSPEDKNKMLQYSWSDMKDRRNTYEQFELTVSTFLEDDVVDSYDGYKDMLFTYNDIKPYLDNLSTYCKEALEASGYKDKGYIDSFLISSQQIIIGVHHKDANISKTYQISKDGKHIDAN